MSRRSFIYFLISVTVVWVVLFQFIFYKDVSKPKEEKKPIKKVQEKKENRVGIPKMLYIPKIQVNAPVESLGLDEERKMDVPQDVDNVGWYDLGFKPGEKGSAVIAGHLDKATGEPAIFYYLYQLDLGDEIFVVDDQNKTYRFLVVALRNYQYDQFPLQSVFADIKSPGLNLITCNGAWDHINRNYSQRMVIYSKLVE